MRLKNLVAEVRNGTWGADSEDDAGVVCIRAADFDRQRLRVSPAKLVRRSITYGELQLHRLNPGDLVLEKSGGGNEQPVGAAVLYDLSFDAIATNFAARVRASSAVDSRFLCYVFAAMYYLRINLRSIKQTTGLQNLDAAAFFNELWAIPDKPQQQAIADFLDRETARIDGLIAKRTSLGLLIKERVRSELFAMVSGKERDGPKTQTAMPGLPECPRHWEVLPLRRVQCEVQTGPFGSQLHADEYITGGYPIVNPANLVGGGIEPDPSITVDEETRARLARHVLRSGDVVFGRRGQLGRAGLVTDEEAGWLCGTGCIRVRFSKPTFHPDFLRLFLQLDVTAQYFESIAVGSTMENLNTESLFGMPLMVPPMNEQLEIAAEANRCEAHVRTLLKRLDSQLRLLIERRQVLITAAVTGELEVSPV